MKSTLGMDRNTFSNSLVKIFKFQLCFAFFPEEMHQQRRLCCTLIQVLSERGKGVTALRFLITHNIHLKCDTQSVQPHKRNKAQSTIHHGTVWPIKCHSEQPGRVILSHITSVSRQRLANINGDVYLTMPRALSQDVS